MSTMQDVVDLARIDLNDADKVRWTDTDLLKHANAAIFQAYDMRPDLKFGNYATAYASLPLVGVFPLPDDYQRAVADYVSARANAVDNDAAEINRSTVFMGNFDRQMVSI